MRRILVIAVCLTAGSAGLAVGQCPLGGVPPCGPKRPAAARKAPPAPALRARQIMLLPFRNVTRAPANDWLVTGAPLMLGEALRQFSDLSIVPEARLAAAMRRLGLALDLPPDATQLGQLADATGGWTAVTGNVIATGRKLRVSAEAFDVPTGNVVAHAVTEIDASADVRQAFDQLTVQLLAAVGVRGSSNLAALTTRSVDAYRAYADGFAFVQQGAFRRGAVALTEAVRIDTGFALAWSTLSFALIEAGGLQEILNPMSAASRAAEQAVRHAEKLSPRQAAIHRVLLGGFHADFARAHRLADSLVATDPEDASAWIWVGVIEMLDSRLDTTKTPPTRAGSFNRSIEAMKTALDKDPSHLEVYSFPASMYGMSAGFLSDVIGARRKPTGSLAAEFLVPQDVYFRPVHRDTIEFIVDTAFARFPAAEIDAANVRGANAGLEWVSRWLVANPNDPEAHLWASRFEEVRGDYVKALTELDRVQALGPESNLENLRARRMSLLELTGQYAAAESLADSIVAAGGTGTPPWHQALDRSRSYAVVTYMRLKRWTKLGELASTFAPVVSGAPNCSAIPFVVQNRQFSIPRAELKAIADTVAAHIDEVRQFPLLAPCAELLSKVQPPSR